MKIRKYLKHFFNVVLVVTTIAVAVFFVNRTSYSFFRGGQSQDSPYAWIQILNEVMIRLKRDYVIDIPTEEIVKAAIKGMERVLDPHTNYFEERDYDDLMISTRGHFGGVGIIISMNEGILTVISPIPESPAYKLGIMAGDIIKYIGEEETGGMTLTDAVSRLRGEKGTDVVVKIKRGNLENLITYTITRDIIQIRSVPFYTKLEDGYGYIRVVNFSGTIAQEIRDAIESLNKQANGNLKGIILDLRNNPGGLLEQSVEVSNLFLDRGKVVVSTKGRNFPEKELSGMSDPIVGRDVKIAVLVNEGSASASEIVAGAVQDWDRGIVVGRRTHGKGSVQSVFPIMETQTGVRAMKITTAYYYTPSGRNINRLEYSAGYNLFKEGDTTIKSDVFDTTKIFRTKRLNRPVRAGGGIFPDTLLEMRNYDLLEINLEAQRMYFDFAVEMKSKNRKFKQNFEVTDKLFEEFIKFAESRGFSYETEEESAFKNLLKRSHAFHFRVAVQSSDSNQNADTIDVAELIGEIRKKDTSLAQQYENLHAQILKHKYQAFDMNRANIKDRIKQEILQVYFGQQAMHLHRTKSDVEVLRTLDILKNGYESILVKSKTE